MKRIKLFIMAFALALTGIFALAPAGVANAAIDPLAESCKNSNSALCKSKDDNVTDTVGDIVNILLWAIGLLSVVMIIVGGIFYVISAGDSGKVAKAKNTIMYAVVGLIVALLAYAIVYWVRSVIK